MREPPEQDAATLALEPAEFALAASEDRFERLVASVLDYGIFMLDPRGHIISWNAGAERINGYEAHEIVGRHFSIFYPTEDVAQGKCERELATAEEIGRFEEEGWRVRKDGCRFWANVVISAMRAPGGELLGFAKVTRDLTERRRAQEELRRSDERLRLLIQSVKEYAIFMLDSEGRVATWNQGAQRLKGYAYEEIVGQHFSRFYPETDVVAGKCEMELEVASRVGSFEDEGWRIRKDGSRFWANVVITAVRDAEGNLVGFAKVTRDLSERKRHEEERVQRARAEEARRLAEESEQRQRALAATLRDARDKAEQLTRLKDEFLATVSHELRTPLSAILGWGRMLQQGGLDEAKARHAMDAIVRNATAQQQIVDDLLDVSRIISGKLRLDVDFVDINTVLNSAIDVVRPAAEAKGVTLQPVLNPDAGLIKGDASRLQQVFWNLLTNAVKFTPRGGRVQISLRRVNSSVQIEVLDNGSGIEPDFLPHVFERFSQADSSHSRIRGGLGLGLSIVKHLIELHGGTVMAHSDGQGKGSLFAVRIPIVPVRSPIQQGESRSSLVPDVKYPAELKHLKVLVVDDEQDARDVVKLILEQGGAQVALAASVTAALEAVRTFQPDVIVSDIGMPEEDGYVFIERLRALPRTEGGRTPAIALTAYARAEDRRRALVAGFQNHAAKPIEPQELVMVVANLARYK